jgi:hypothetical protein
LLAAAMALSGVAQAAPIGDSADAQCLKLAIKTLPNFKPAHYTFHGGSEDIGVIDDFTGEATEGNDVFCGFGGVLDGITTLDEGDIFLVGGGEDVVVTNNGTFYGQEGNDGVEINSGTFDGGDGTEDFVVIDNGGCARNVVLGDVGLPC